MPKKDEFSIRDLAEFCEKWPSLRGKLTDEHLSRLIEDAQTQRILTWLVHLADRTCSDFSDLDDLKSPYYPFSARS